MLQTFLLFNSYHQSVYSNLRQILPIPKLVPPDRQYSQNPVHIPVRCRWCFPLPVLPASVPVPSPPAHTEAVEPDPSLPPYRQSGAFLPVPVHPPLSEASHCHFRPIHFRYGCLLFPTHCFLSALFPVQCFRFLPPWFLPKPLSPS